MPKASRPIALAAALLVLGAAPLGPAEAQAPDMRTPFEAARGTLPWPVAGRQIVGFGQPTSDGRSSSGIVIAARPRALVVSPCDGLLVYAGEFRSYGPLVIIQAGDGYQFMLTGLSVIDAQVGQKLAAGEPIGTLPGSERDGAPPRLHLSLLQNGRPIDPAPWLRKS
jgi:septal ring factor EnvC (AmiA/AmiB activator)